MKSRIWLNSLLLSPTVTITTFVVSFSTVTAEVPIPNQNITNRGADFSQKNQLQVTSVSQLSDVQLTDWAFVALQSLVERYGCIAGYPDGSYRGKRVITRYEFAAGLNACLARINELITTATVDLITKQDLTTLQKLEKEFATELALLGNRINMLKSRTSKLQANQFSTTTKLTGEAIFAVASIFGNDAADRDSNPNNNSDLQDNIILSHRVRLNFDTSFTGKDFLRVRLQARNLTEFQGDVTGTRMTRLGFDGDDGNNVGLDDLYYYFPIGNKVKVTLVAVEGKLNDFVNTFNPLESSGSGSISRFGRFNPIYRVSDGTGVGINYEFTKSTNFSLAYLASDANDSTDKNGLFNGNYGALVQFAFKPMKNLDVGLTYVRSYYAGGGSSGVNLTGNTGSANARRPFGNVATSADSFGFQTSFRINPKLIVSGWVGYSFVESEVSNDSANIFNYAVTLALRDLGRKGNLAGIIIGMPPKVTESSSVSDRGTSLHLEGFYRVQVADNISITPGLFVITNPEHNNNNDSIFVGVIRTTFKF